MSVKMAFIIENDVVSIMCCELSLRDEDSCYLWLCVCHKDHTYGIRNFPESFSTLCKNA